jgi:hypothetical protein
LKELAENDPVVAKIDSAFTYDPSGLSTPGGKSWLISTANPKEEGKVILGKLPIEVFPP